jgi:hypothetical protein
MYLASKDHCGSWEMCTTSIESRTIMTAVLTIMSGMDPHTISRNMVEFGYQLGVWVVLLFGSIYHNGFCGMVDVVF